MESDIVKLVRRLNPQDYHDGYLAGLRAAQTGIAQAADLQAAQAGIAQIIQDFERMRQTIHGIPRNRIFLAGDFCYSS
jgi:hypothetical protein